MQIDLIEGLAPRLEYRLPNVHPAWCRCVQLAFFQCAVAHLEEAVAQRQAEVQHHPTQEEKTP